jgi:hypothetical protein
MADDIEDLLRRLIGGDASALTEVLLRAGTSGSPKLLVAAALVAEESDDLLSRAAASAVSTRDRQLVAVAAAHLVGNADVLDVLVREHLSEYPDNLLAAWIATEQHRPSSPTPPTPRSNRA